MLATLIVNVIRKFVFIYSGAQPGQGRGGLVGLGCFYKHFVKNTRKKCLAEKNLGVFSPRYSKNYILNGKFNSKMGTIRAFFTKSAHFFLIFKIRQGRPPPSPPRSSYAPVYYGMLERGKTFNKFFTISSTRKYRPVKMVDYGLWPSS